MNFLLFFAAALVGYFIGAFCAIGPLCCLRFGIPFAKKMQDLTGVDMSRMIKQQRLTLSIYIIIDAILIAALVLFVPPFFAKGIAFGIVITLVMGYSETGLNKNNLTEFLKRARQLLPASDWNTIMNYLENEPW